MGERHDLPRIKPQQPPSYFNKEAGLWGSVGNIAANLASEVSGRSRNGLTYGLTAAGIIYGAVKGKARQEREQVEGRVVQTPTFWNSGFWSGGLVAGIAMMPFINRISPSWATAISVGGSVFAMQTRKENMKKDYDQAIAMRSQHIQHQQQTVQDLAAEVAQLKAQQNSYKNSVSKDETAALEAQLAAPKNHADTVTQTRAEAEQQASAVGA